MKKLLDWIADKLGYQRKWKAKPWPLTYIPASVMKEREDDNCLPPGYIKKVLEEMWVGESSYLGALITESEKEFIDFRPIETNGD